jgi:mRNA interferase RelE/StbE
VTYTLAILRTAQRELARIDPRYRSRIIESIRALGANPRPPGCCKLSGRDAWRIRVGDYRVLYEIHDSELRVVVITLGHRREVYR